MPAGLLVVFARFFLRWSEEEVGSHCFSTWKVESKHAVAINSRWAAVVPPSSHQLSPLGCPHQSLERTIQKKRELSWFPHCCWTPAAIIIGPHIWCAAGGRKLKGHSTQSLENTLCLQLSESSSGRTVSELCKWNDTETSLLYPSHYLFSDRRCCHTDKFTGDMYSSLKAILVLPFSSSPMQALAVICHPLCRWSHNHNS